MVIRSVAAMLRPRHTMIKNISILLVMMYDDVVVCLVFALFGGPNLELVCMNN